MAARAFHLNSSKAWEPEHILLACGTTDTGLQLDTYSERHFPCPSMFGVALLVRIFSTMEVSSLCFYLVEPLARGPLVRQLHSALLQANRHLAGCKLADHCKELNGEKQLGLSLQTYNSHPRYNRDLLCKRTQLWTSILRLCSANFRESRFALEPMNPLGADDTLFCCRDSHAQHWPKHTKTDERLEQVITALEGHVHGLRTVQRQADKAGTNLSTEL